MYSNAEKLMRHSISFLEEEEFWSAFGYSTVDDQANIS